MLRTLLSPLSSRFPITPRPDAVAHQLPDVVEEETPEDFARDVLLEVMRNAVERLKVAMGLNERTEVLIEVHGIMVQDACTKDVFREMDGFLVLMSVLSTIQPSHSWSLAGPNDEIVHEVLEAVRLVFTIISEAMDDHKANTAFFERSVGYDSLANSVLPLVSDEKTVEQTLGFLVSLAVRNFSLAGVFIHPENYGCEDVDAELQNAEPMLKLVRHPSVLRVLFFSMAHFPERNASRLRYTILKLLEQLTHHSHRNHAVLASLELVGPLFDLYQRSATEKTPFHKHQRQVIVRLLKKLLELGTGTAVAKDMFQRAINDDDTLSGDVLELLRAGMKTRWPEHLSLEGSAAISIPASSSRVFPSAGFTVLLWVRIDKLPSEKSQSLFSFNLDKATLFSLRIHSDGKLSIQSSANKQPHTFQSKVQTSRWTHIGLMHYPHRSSAPTIRLVVDGVLGDTVNWSYPRNESSPRAGTYIVGDASASATMSWALASAYLISTPLADEAPRYIQHLGPRYGGRFQAGDLVKFMTYEASTSLSIYLASVMQMKTPSTMASMIKNGLGLSADAVVFTLTPSLRDLEVSDSTDQVDILRGSGGAQLAMEGDVIAVKNVCLDLSMWRLGGAAIPLRLVQLARTSHELSRTLAILAGGLRNDWQNSEDMERIRGYEILADMLRSKANLINITSFEILFEFLGLSFRSPDQSTITNAAAYRAIALDLQLWSQTRTEIQHAHLEHFTMLLHTSKYKKFNAKQRLGKMNAVRRFLFALQANWYQLESVPWLIDTMKLVVESDLSTNDVIKPLVAYLAANLHPDISGANSPQSMFSAVSRFNLNDAQLKAEQILQMFVAVMQNPTAFNKLAAALPLTRIYLLLLGERPSPLVATQVLRLIEIALRASTSFIRKFELVSGWNVLKVVLPVAWSPSVQAAAFDILMGGSASSSDLVVQCPQILPTIFACLHQVVAGTASFDDETRVEAGAAADALLEELIKIYSSSPTFRQAFQSQTTTQVFLEAFRSFVSIISTSNELHYMLIRVLEKLCHLALTISLDSVVSSGQKQEIVEILQAAELVLNPDPDQTHLDPRLIVNPRRRGRRLPSMRLSVQLGERTVQRTMSRILEWRRTVMATERKRLRKNILDLKEQRRQVASLTDWATVLITERGLWSIVAAVDKWRLDETEGPYRVRKKLEPEVEKLFHSQVDNSMRNGKIQEPAFDSQSVLQADIPPWAETYELSGDVEERALDEEVVDDKHRRVRHELEAGDVISAAETVARISGIDSCPGLLILGKTHLYMLDGLVQNDDGEVVDAHDAPKKLFFVPGSSIELNGPQRAQRWPYEQVSSYSDRTFLFRDVALEIYLKDSRSLLVVFAGKDKRRAMSDKLSSMLSSERYGDSLTPGLQPAPLGKSPIVSMFSSKISSRVTSSTRALMGFRPDELSTAQRKWQAREISNFTYLSILNQVSGRTPSDATQYPVFPWVISDYSSKTLNFDSPETYRDLSKPMGALNEARREEAISRYTNLLSVDEKPFHYGTHFSSSMIVCHFMIRIEPFTHMFKTLQGGNWDLPDRLFSDMKRAYESAAVDMRGDVRELIPEFYTCPEFLENSANLDFGVMQNTGERIHHVKLPPWAKDDPFLFVTLNRQALESDYVSENLPAWIDLIWGHKQRDVESVNVFHPLSYEGSIDLDSITDELEREATVGIIHNFGQTPRKLFNHPHPERMMHGTSSLPLGTIYGVPEDFHLLSQSTRHVKDLGADKPVQELVIDLIGERIIACPAGTLAIPSRPHETIQWDPKHTPSGELRVVVDRKAIQVIEGAFVSSSAFADADTLATGCTDYTVRLWKLNRGGQHERLNVSLTHIMRAHSAEVTCVAASRAWSLVVSGSKDGSVGLWDLNKGVYVRSIWHGDRPQDAVHIVQIQESTGHIASCSQEKLWLHTVNARPITMLDLRDGPASPLYPPITALAFHEREYSKLPVIATGSPDGTISLRTWNTDNTPEDEKAVWEFVTLKKMKVKGADGTSQPRGLAPCVTALRFVGESLYHGEDTGKAYVWTLPD